MCVVTHLHTDHFGFAAGGFLAFASLLPGFLLGRGFFRLGTFGSLGFSSVCWYSRLRLLRRYCNTGKLSNEDVCLQEEGITYMYETGFSLLLFSWISSCGSWARQGPRVLSPTQNLRLRQPRHPSHPRVRRLRSRPHPRPRLHPRLYPRPHHCRIS